MKEIKPRIKPVLPTAQTPSPEELERSYQEAMRRMSGENEVVETPILAPKVEPEAVASTPKPAPKKVEKAVVKPKPVAKPTKKATENEENSNRAGKHRLTIDLPDDLFALVEAHKIENGQSFTWLVAKLLKDFFANK